MAACFSRAGRSRGRAVASAELYDPLTGRFNRTDSMTIARYKTAAVTLRSGRVLVIGGAGDIDGTRLFASTELYDPRTRRFRPGPPMHLARYKLTGRPCRCRSATFSSPAARSRPSATTPGRGHFGSCQVGSTTRACFSRRLRYPAAAHSSWAATTRRSARRPPPGSTASNRPSIRSCRGLPLLCHGEPTRRKVLRRVRHGACARLSGLRRGERSRASASAASAVPRSARSRPTRRPLTRAAPAAERRLVSVLFADLVGFTALSESRDAEEVRELLSRYFDTCRRLIELYGGTVEKFIGDAVMAVWGTPTATEDDAERAVRAALDLVAAVSALGEEVGARGAPRAGGRAHRRGGRDARRRGRRAWSPATSSTRRRGCSRSPSRARCFVGESTRRATEQTIVYEEAGSFELKGKEGLTPLWRAQRVVSGRARLAQVAGARGAVRRPRPRAAADQGPVPRVRRREEGAPRLGDRHRRDRQVASRLGVLQVLRRHRRDRLLAPRALPLLRRGRDLLGARRHGAHALPDRRGRGAGVRAGQAARDAGGAHPRLRRSGASSSRGSRTCSGSAEHQARDQQDLFAAWRLFFERLAEGYPTVLAFEDMQWADASLLDFVEYLLDWSRNSPDLRDHARAAGAARAPADLGRRPAQLHLALPRAAVAGGDGGAADRPRARASRRRCATRSSPAPKACRCTRSRRCGCCSTAACSSRRAPPTG